MTLIAKGTVVHQQMTPENIVLLIIFFNNDILVIDQCWCQSVTWSLCDAITIYSFQLSSLRSE